MKKLTVLVMIMLVASLLVGCWPTYRITPNLAGNTVYLGREIAGVINHFQLEMTYSNGNIDVTSACEYVSDNTDVATVGNEIPIKGLIEAGDPFVIGEANINITYWNGTHEYSFDVIAVTE